MFGYLSASTATAAAAQLLPHQPWSVAPATRPAHWVVARKCEGSSKGE